MLLTGLFLYFSPAKADEIKGKSTVTEVTVYQNQGRETRTSTVTIPKGYVDVVLTDIPMNMIENSLQVGVKGSATLLSASTRINHFHDDVDPLVDSKAKKLRDSIEYYSNETLWMQEQRNLYTIEIDLITAHNKLGTAKESFKLADLVALADLYRNRITELKKKIFDFTLKEKKITELVNKHKNELNELGKNKKSPVKEIVLSFSAESAGTLSLKSLYLVSSCGWKPLYDIRVLNVTQPVNLDYRAAIYQSTGYDWKDVKITLSTANPSKNHNRPILNPRFIDYVQYVPQQIRAGLADQNVSMNMMQTKSLKSTEYDYQPNYEVEVIDNGMSVEFEINALQKITSNGKEHVCFIQTQKIPSTYTYHAVPKLQPNVYLMAKITDYGKFNLLPGQANIFFNDMYIGPTQINPNQTGDTLLLSLGIDEKIAIKRTKVADKTSRKLLAESQKETYAWEIHVKNNKTNEIEIEILDQIPVSKQNDIKVLLIEKSNAKYTETYGKLLWNVKLKPGESKKLSFSYSVEHPKGKNVQEF